MVLIKISEDSVIRDIFFFLIHILLAILFILFVGLIMKLGLSGPPGHPTCDGTEAIAGSW